MEALQAILTRRSIRSYTPQGVTDEQVHQILAAGMAAPSAGGQAPWHFVVIRDRPTLDTIRTVHPYAQMLAEATVAILVACDEREETHKGFWVQDCAAATENMLVAIQGLGLGAVWLGVYPREARVAGIRQILGMPDHLVPFALLPIGYPAESLPEADRYDESRVHHDRW